jgi:hypothetical protein
VLALPLLIKILLEKDDDKKKEKEKEKEKDRKSTDSNHSDGRARDKEHTAPSSALTTSNSNSNSNSSSSSSSGRGASSITCSTIVQIFDAEMILLIMQDVIGMTCHGINTSSSSSSSSSSSASSATQGGGLERTISQDRESRDAPEGAERDADRDRDRESKEGSSRIEAEERGGDDLERGRKRDPLGSDKDSSLGQSDAASNLKIELLKVGDVAK